jgi:hypothetical protein
MSIDTRRRSVFALALVPAVWLIFEEQIQAASAIVGDLPPIAVPDRPSFAEFMRLSDVLTGRNDLNRAMGLRIYELILVEPYGLQHVVRVYERIRTIMSSGPDRTHEAALIAKIFDSGERWFIGHLLVTWYTGVYYHSVGNRRVGFEEALMYRVLEDMMAPPGTCGSAGFWAAKPSRVGPFE